MRVDLSVKYLGLTLKNPIIVGSSGLTASVERIKSLEKNNAAAVVLKSLFEEQILMEGVKEIGDEDFLYPEAYDYIKQYSENYGVDKYLDLVEKATKNVEIPVIASINCAAEGDWSGFAKKVEQAGAKALEVNIAILPTDETKTAADYEKLHLNILREVRKAVSIPIAVKLSYYGTNLAYLIKRIAWEKIADAVVLFNRFYNPDFDIDNFEITSSHILSHAEDIMPALRWIALLSPKIKTQFVATTGIFTGLDIVKQILAGATAVQVVSAIYKMGESYIDTLLQQIKDWMREKEFPNLDAFRGKMSFKNVPNPQVFERVQFMKYYGNFE